MNSETLLARIYTLDPTADAPGLPTPHPAPAGQPRPAEADGDEAEEFVRLHHGEHPDQPLPLTARLQQIRTQINETGTYTHTADELVFGARVAWRNSSRCIGRLYWKSLRVLDRRQATTAEDIHQHLCDHLRQATNGGRIRPVISIFAPDTPDNRAPRVWNDQLIRYAGHRQDNGSTVGDPTYADFTDTVKRLGWQALGGPWDVLPWVIETAQDKPQLFDVPPDLVLEVHLTHPDRPDFADLGLRWHAVPAISNMRLRIGGINYPLAPFNGWYMGTEIGGRNLVDTDRYNLLPVIAEHLGLDTSSDTTLWRDRALVELNVAVLHSFTEAGVKISDHHTESRHFMTHLAKEEKQGRTVPADWSWIVPPVSGGITPVFHRYYDEADQRPNFYLDDDAKARGKGRCPFGHD
ncbi:nitric oxide synthase oxygenase (plasmid) [Streptomyces sp. G6]|uniref:nitric oxide synthase oxygenase n=1 Tax=Streptomyces sp. G6 TaxID=1178736 RepID=UPI003ED937B8